LTLLFAGFVTLSLSSRYPLFPYTTLFRSFETLYLLHDCMVRHDSLFSCLTIHSQLSVVQIQQSFLTLLSSRNQKALINLKTLQRQEEHTSELQSREKVV